MQDKRLWLLLPLAIYLLLPTRNFYWDGVTFAILAEKHAPLRETLHPNHLIYTTSAVWLYEAVEFLGTGIRALFLFQAVNSILAAAAAYFIFRALSRRGLSTSAAISGALLFAFSATWWKFATDANAYIPSIFFLLYANDLLEENRSPLKAGLALAAAMLFHELAIFYLPVAWLRTKQRGRYTMAALIPVAVAYVLAFRAVFGAFDARRFLAWIVASTPDAHFSFNILRNVALTATGTLRLFFGGKLSQARGALLVIAAIVLLAAMILLAKTLRRPALTRPDRGMLLWAVVTAVFLFFWIPQNTFYRLFYFAPLLLIVAVWLKDAKVLTLLCVILFTWNLVFLIYPQSRIENNPPLRFALAQQARWPASTPIVFHNFHPDLWTISYFNQQAAWTGMLTADYDLLNRKLPLWLDSTAYDFLSTTPAGRDWLLHHTAETLTWRDPLHSNIEYRFYRMR